MKQLDDTFTIDMHGDTQVITPDNSTAIKPKVYHRFYVVTADDNGGEHCTEWRGLSKKQARDMYAYTQQSNPWNVIKCGWEECK
jgi:hypothetical protein